MEIAVYKVVANSVNFIHFYFFYFKRTDLCDLQNKNLMGQVLREASFSLAEAKFTAGDFSHTVVQNVSRAQHRVRMKKENVVGMICS